MSKKLSVQFGPDSVAVIERLAERKGTTQADGLRRALTAYEYLTKENQDHERNISITTRDGKILKDVVLP